MASQASDSADSRGIALLGERIELAKQTALALLDAPPPTSTEWLITGRHYVVSGIGSSEAHARYLVSLINRCGQATAEFASLLELARGDARLSGKHLVVFSQGLSPNAALVLNRVYDTVGTTVFTAATIEGLRAAGKTIPAAALAGVKERGANIESSPLTDEYTILLRVVGPMAGYLAIARHLDKAGWLNEALPARADLQATFTQAETLASEQAHWATTWQVGIELNFADTTFTYAQNLAYKRVEGIFAAQPILRDLLQYSHGPFQFAMTGQSPAQWLLAADGPGTDAWLHTATPLFARPPEGFQLVRSPLPEPFAILFYEHFLNCLTVQVAHQNPSINQLDWPGKGQDRELYGLAKAPV